MPAAADRAPPGFDPARARVLARGARSRSRCSRARCWRPPPARRGRPSNRRAIHHVWVIVLENEGYASTFGDPAADPYLAQTLPAQGALLENYYATGHESNDNYISLVSGQPPNAAEPGRLPDLRRLRRRDSMLPSGVEAGDGLRLPGRSAEHRHPALGGRAQAWKAYQQDMGNDPNRETAACGHPALERATTKRRKPRPATATPPATTRSSTSTR